MGGLRPGEVVGDRFEVLGVIGRGGSAVVYLARDRVRSERVALKVVHEHLTADPSVRRRLHREVQAATVLRTASALVPYDLHELDGHLALSMPFHPGQALDQHVAAHGPLSVEEARRLGQRVAEALAEAHRAGVLHRDVTPANILLSPGAEDAALSDFGLARVRQGAATRSTTALGTAGYAAPEIYDGDRGDPRSDLYGLGAALYLALTGQPAFDTRDPLTALRQQLDDAFVPVRERRPDAPDDLVDLVEALLRADPEGRPQGAREVLDLLEQQAIFRPPTAEGVVRQYLPPGRWTVVVKEREEEDFGRRAARRAERRQAPETLGASLHRLAVQGIEWTRSRFGLPPDERITPEEVLANAVAHEAGLQPGALLQPDVLFYRRFRLVDRTDEGTAHRLAEAARIAGFRARHVCVGRPESRLEQLAALTPIVLALGWSAAFPAFILLEVLVLGQAPILSIVLALPLLILLSIAMPIWAFRHGIPDRRAEQRPVAYPATLEGALTQEAHPPPRFAVAAVTKALPRSSEEAPTRGEALLERVRHTLAGLSRAIEDPALALPAPAQQDLRGTVRELGASAEALAQEVDRLEEGLDEAGAPEREVGLLYTRRDRLQTLQRAGETVDETALARVEHAIAEHEASLAAAAKVEARLAASTAQLLEIASTAAAVHRTLLAESDPAPRAPRAAERLRQEVEATRAAQREAALRSNA